MDKLKKITLSLIAFILVAPIAHACTVIQVSRSATNDGSLLMSYNFDMFSHAGELIYLPASSNNKGAVKKIYEWDTGKYLGEIPESKETFTVIGNMNEYQLSISESTFGGRKELINPNGIMDYGALIFTTLQRTKTAREAIHLFNQLVNQYGYYSSGEEFTFMDKKEVWIMDLIGKGPGVKGAVWVARKLPEGYISVSANNARITTFPLDDPDNTLYSHDVISFARKKGYFTGDDHEFNFRDAYSPLTFSDLRMGEARVWSVFNKVAKGMDQYLPYVKGDFSAKPLPLWIKPSKKLSLTDVISLNRDHYENTELDMRRGIGAGPFNLPYRWRNLKWKVGEQEYFHDRPISTQQTAFTTIAQVRPDKPNALGGILWFGADDSYTTVYTPLYSSINQIPESFAVKENTVLNFSWDSAHWVFNVVSNFAYLRYDLMIDDIKSVQSKLEKQYISEIEAVDQQASKIYKESDIKARQFLTQYSLKAGNNTLNTWKQLSNYLMVKYIDGNVRKEANGKFMLNDHGFPELPSFPGYSDYYYSEIVKESNGKYRVPPKPKS